MKNSLINSLFSHKSCVFSSKILSSLKIYHFKLYIVENRGLKMPPDDVECIPKQVLMQKTFHFWFLEPQHMHACPCMRTHTQAELEHACVYACIHTHALGFLWPFFSQKKTFILPKLSYIFHKEFPQVKFHLIRP